MGPKSPIRGQPGNVALQYVAVLQAKFWRVRLGTNTGHLSNLLSYSDGKVWDRAATHRCLAVSRGQQCTVKTDIQLPAPEASSEAKHPSPEGACWALVISHKRRILQADVIDTLARKLKPSGQLHLATDWDDYAEHMREEMAASEHFELTSSERGERPMTRFEQRGLRLRHRVQDLVYTRR